MRAKICVLTGVLLVGCAANTEEVQMYYESIQSSNDAVMESIKKQAEDNSLRRTAAMTHFSQAMVSAAKTPSQTDDVVVAFAWGFQSNNQDQVTIPDLIKPKPPVTDVDRIRAWTPIISTMIPIITPFVYNWSGSFDNDETYTFTAQDGGKININSQNAGSYNTAKSGTQTISVSEQDNSMCVGCETEPDPNEVGIEVLPTDYTLEECLANPPGGIVGGIPMLTSSCSCSSRFIEKKC